MRSLTLRRTALPAWYLVATGGMIAVYPAMEALPRLVPVLWFGHLVLVSSVLFAMEVFGARRFAASSEGDDAEYLRRQSHRVVEGYSLAARVRYIADATACWLVFGIATVVLAAALGGAMLEASPALQGAAAAVRAWPAVLRVGLAFALLDLWSYWRHRVEHARGEDNFLWRQVHRRHHVPDEIDLWTGMIVHPVESVLVFGLPCTLFAAVGFERWELLWMFSFFLTITMPQHMNSGWQIGALGAVIHGPEAHTRHHSAVRQRRLENLADCFTVWDRIFGTWVVAPSRPFAGPYGLGDETAPAAPREPKAVAVQA